jgi:AcrR family transcriptional regulator
MTRWTATVDTHRRAVREAILETTWALATEHGPLSLTMSQIAEATGIGRATLYKYFPDVEAILSAWHERHVDSHLEHLAALRDQAGEPDQKLRTVLEAYALIVHHRDRHGAELVALLHRGQQPVRAEQQLVELIESLLIDTTRTGDVRDDLAPGELARYCLHSLAAAGAMTSEDAVRRLVTVTLDGLRPSP